MKPTETGAMALDDILKEIQRLETAAINENGFYRGLTPDVAIAKAEWAARAAYAAGAASVAEQEQLLRKYARHKETCEHELLSDDKNEVPCTCGWAEAEKMLEEGVCGKFAMTKPTEAGSAEKLLIDLSLRDAAFRPYDLEALGVQTAYTAVQMAEFARYYAASQSGRDKPRNA